jgi:ApbE superfamily uncharacterized protein (UPF0280 family)
MLWSCIFDGIDNLADFTVMYEERFYRGLIKDNDLVSFTVTVKETDLYIKATKDLHDVAISVVKEKRARLEEYIQRHPLFLHSLKPLAVEEDEADIVRMMAAAGQTAGVGPMAAVAGAIAELVGKELLKYSPEVIIENGGDIFLKIDKKRAIGIFAGQSVLSGRIALEIKPGMTPAGICTSSGTVGPSLSLGLADAVVVYSRSAALADAAATAVCNMVKSEDDISNALELGRKIEGVRGLLIITGEKMGAWGNIKLLRL